MRPRRPHVASRNEVTMSRSGESATITYSDPAVRPVVFAVGADIDQVDAPTPGGACASRSSRTTRPSRPWWRFAISARAKLLTPGGDTTARVPRDVAPSASVSAQGSAQVTRVPPDGRSIEALAETLTFDLAGTMMPVAQIFERHSPDRLYVMPNYREALLRLEAASRVTMTPPVAERRSYRGKPSLAEDVLVTFPRLRGTGAKIEASRSTPDRRAFALPTSASARPTA